MNHGFRLENYFKLFHKNIPNFLFLVPTVITMNCEDAEKTTSHKHDKVILQN